MPSRTITTHPSCPLELTAPLRGPQLPSATFHLPCTLAAKNLSQSMHDSYRSKPRNQVLTLGAALLSTSSDPQSCISRAALLPAWARRTAPQRGAHHAMQPPTTWAPVSGFLGTGEELVGQSLAAPRAGQRATAVPQLGTWHKATRYFYSGICVV